MQGVLRALDSTPPGIRVVEGVPDRSCTWPVGPLAPVQDADTTPTGGASPSENVGGDQLRTGAGSVLQLTRAVHVDRKVCCVGRGRDSKQTTERKREAREHDDKRLIF